MIVSAKAPAPAAPAGYQELKRELDDSWREGYYRVHKSALRKVWAGQFDTSIPEKDRSALRGLLRESFADSSSPSFAWALAHYPFESQGVATSALMLENPILVPVLIGGYYFATAVGCAMVRRGQPFDLAMLGCHRDGTEDKKIRPHKVYIQEADETFLSENRARQILLLEDACETGRTIETVLSYVLKLGCKQVFLGAGWMCKEPKGFVYAGNLYRANSAENITVF